MGLLSLSMCGMMQFLVQSSELKATYLYKRQASQDVFPYDISLRGKCPKLRNFRVPPKYVHKYRCSKMLEKFQEMTVMKFLSKPIDHETQIELLR